MTTVNVGTTKNTVTVNGQTRVVTVKTGETRVVTVKVAGPQGPGFSDGNKGDVTIANNGASITINSGAVTSTKLANSGVTSGSYGSGSAIPTITVNDKGIVTGISTNSVNTTTNLSTTTSTTDVTIASSTGSNALISEASGSAAGVMSVAHHDKLDGIESNATADQTAAEILALLSDQNITTTGTLGTGDITISKAFNPSITFNDGNNENDFEVSNAGGLFRIRDIDAGFNRFTISSASGGNNGVTSINNHLDVGNGLDVTGNITSTGSLTINNATPLIRLADTTPSGQTAYDIKNTNSTLRITDSTNGVDRLQIHGNGSIHVSGNFNANSGLDVTGGDITGVLGSAVTGTTQSASDNSTKIATTAYTDTAIANLVSSAPSTLDTLNELAAALGDDPNFATTVTNSIATKLPLSGGTLTGDLTIDKNNPVITFSDDNNNPDYQVGNVNGVLRFQDTTNNATRFQVNTDGHVDFLSNVDFASGIDVTGQIVSESTTGTGSTGLKIANSNESFVQYFEGGGANATFVMSYTGSGGTDIRFAHNGEIQVNYAGQEKFKTTSTGVSVTGEITGTSHLDLPSDAVLKLGNSDEFQIFHNSPNGNSIIKEIGGGGLSIQSNGNFINFWDSSNGRFFAQFNTNGACQFRHGADIRLETTSTGVDVTGHIDITGELNLTGGGNKYFDVDTLSGTHSLRIRHRNNDGTQFDDAAKFTADGGADLYFNGGSTPKLSTTATGVDVNGVINVSSSANGLLTLTSTTRHAGFTMIDSVGSSGLQNRDGNIRFLAGGNASGSGASDVLFINGALKRVGIGTTSVGATLHLSSTLPELRFTDTDNNNIDHFISCSGSAMTLKADESQEDNAGDTTIRFHIDTVERGRFDDAGLDVTGNLAVDTDTLFVDSANDKVGINQASPTYQLDLVGTQRNTVSAADTNILILNANMGTNNNRGFLIKAPVTDSGSQPFRIQTGNALEVQIDNNKTLNIDSSGQINLHHAGSSTAKLFTDATGIGVNGVITTNDITLEDLSPTINFKDTNADADNQRWDFKCGGSNTFIIQAINDAGGGGGGLFKITRSGNNLSTFEAQKSGATWFTVDNVNKKVITEDLDVTGNLAVDTDTLFVDSTNDRVGINFASPANALDVTGMIRSYSTGGGQGTSGLRIGTATENFDMFFGAGTANSQFSFTYGGSGGADIVVTHDGIVKLFNGGGTTPKLETTATGVNVEGTATISNIGNNQGLNLDGAGNNTCLHFTSTGSSPAHGFRIALHSPTNSRFGSPALLFDKINNSTRAFSSHIAGISDDGFHLDDNKKIHLGSHGATGDLQIYHNALNSWIVDQGTGHLIIGSNGDRVRIAKGAGAESMAEFITDGANELYFDGGTYSTPKLKTTATGVQVNGNLDIDTGMLIIDTNADSPNTSYGLQEAIRIDDAGSNLDRGLHIYEYRQGGMRFHSLNYNLASSSTGSAYQYTQGNYAGSLMLRFDGTFKFYADAQVTSGSTDVITPTERFRVDTDGADVFGNLYITSAIPQIFLTDTGDNPDYVIQNNNGQFRIYDSTNNASRLTLTATGLGVPGTVVATGDGTFDDIRVGEWSHATNFGGVFHKDQTGQEYMMINNGSASSGHTYISARTNQSVFIRGGNNSNTNQIEVDPTEGINLTAANGVNILDGIIDFSSSADDHPYIKMKDNTGTAARVKYAVWSSSGYGMGMTSGMSYGSIGNQVTGGVEFATTFQMNNSNSRGWVFLDSSHSNAQGAMSLTTQGRMTVAHSMRLGYGESDTTESGATHALDVSGSANITGTVNSVDLSTYQADGSSYLRSNTTDTFENGTLNIRTNSNSGHYWGFNVHYVGANTQWEYLETGNYGFALRNSGADGFHIKVASAAGVAGAVPAYKDFKFNIDGKLNVPGHVVLDSFKNFIAAADSNDNKFDFFGGNGVYAIGMSNGWSYGGLNGWSMNFHFNNNNAWGWAFKDSAHSKAQGAMALTTEGKMTVAHSLRLGHGDSDTAIPATAYTAGSENGHIAGSYRLDVKGKLRVETDDLGTTAGDQQELALFKTVPNANRSFLSFFTQRDTDGTNWTTAYTRIQQFIDTTAMSYIQFNGTDNTNGMEFGRGTGGAKFIFCDFGGPVKLYHNNNERFATADHGANMLNGSLGTNGTIELAIGRNDALNNQALFGFKYSGTSGSNDNKAVIGMDGNRELITVGNTLISLLRPTTVTGTLTCTSLTETSDIALKENIQPLSNVLDKVKQLTGYKYNFKNKEKASMGVIAQDVEKVFPELVHGEEGKKSLQYSGLVGALIEAVKELSAKVAVLESK